MFKLQHLKYLLVFIFQIRLVFGDAQWYVAADGSNYLLDTDYKYNWFNALVECTSRNLSLVTITTDAKNKALVDLIKGLGKEYFWLGAVNSPSGGERTFHWVATGEKLGYSSWYKGEPNGGLVENCVHIELAERNYQWNDNRCATKNFGLLCEESPRDVNEQEEANNRRGFIYGLNHVLNTLLENTKRGIDNLLANVINKGQQTQDQVDAILAT